MAGFQPSRDCVFSRSVAPGSFTGDSNGTSIDSAGFQGVKAIFSMGNSVSQGSSRAYLEGSNDDSTWTTVTSSLFVNGFDFIADLRVEAEGYRYYRWRIDHVAGTLAGAGYIIRLDPSQDIEQANTGIFDNSSTWQSTYNGE